MGRRAWGAILAGVLGLAAVVRADELRLKDGTKITGTIVGFEKDSFRVKTSYGFAVVRKDQIASIAVSSAGEKPEKSGAPADPPRHAKNAAPVTADAKPPKQPARGEIPAQKPAKEIAAKRQPTGAPTAAAAPPNPVSPNSLAANPSAAAAAPQSATPAPAPAAAVLPAPIREQVLGNTYTNLTYSFRMYKPPDWQVIAGAPALLPGAITAMGTQDQTTYLLIGTEPWTGNLAQTTSVTEDRVRAALEDFRPQGDKAITISDMRATERRFRGTVDGQDWSGVVVLLPRGAQLFTIFGMTLADNDLVQIQENVINRAISSIQFLP